MKASRGSRLFAEIIGAATAKSSVVRRLVARAPLQDLALSWGSHSIQSATVGSENRTRFLVRVDDFPAHDKDNSVFLEFHSLMAERHVPYLLGVTPNLAGDPLDSGGTSFRGFHEPDAAVLRQVCQYGVELALHGFTHRMRGPRLRSEFSGVPEPEIRFMVERSLEILASWGLPAPIAFIPPFNSVDRPAARVISDYLPVLCGGPETIHSIGFRSCPAVLEGMEFWPSFFPAYGSAQDVSHYVRRMTKRNESFLVPITLHWRWEKANEFHGVREFVDAVEGRVERWSDCLGRHEIIDGTQNGVV